jgi:plasmid stabilization system protein ParE
MSKPVVLRQAAREEFDEAADWYEARQPGLGAQFVAAVQVVFDRISAHPQLHAVVRRDIRKAVVSGFPYSVYYREQQTRVVVIAVFHSSRDPAIWQGRN